MTRHPIVPPELRRGPFTLDEAEQAGLTRKHLRGGSCRRIGRGLYVWAGLAEGPALDLVAVRRRFPNAAVFSGRTAAWLHGLDLPPCDPVEVTVSSGCGVSGRAGVAVYRADLSCEEVVERRGMRATSMARTVADLGRRLPLVESVVAADMALHRGDIRPADLEAHAASHPRQSGIAQLRRVIELAEPAAESAMETRLRLLLVLSGLPRPNAQVPLYDHRGHLLGRPDLYYPAERLALEYDGGTHRDRLVDDNRRQNRLVNAGIRLLRFTAADVQRTPGTVISQVRAALTSGRSPASGPLESR